MKDKILVGWSHAGEGVPLKSKQKRENIEKYNYIITINEVMKQGYEKNTKKPEIKKIYNFMDLENIILKSKEPLDKNFGEYIISVGSLTENKNHKLLIESFSELKREKKINEKLIILGEGKERENLENLIKKENMENEIFLLGQRKNPYNYMANAKIFILPSKQEGMPLTLIEALALEKMIIATKNNGSIEILNSKYGVLIDNEKNILSRSIYYYLENKEERVKYENLSKERIKEFEKEKIKKEIEEFIDKLWKFM